MKKLIATVVIAMLVLSGCGMFRSHSEWNETKQENPLELPPAIDSPMTGGAQPTVAPAQGGQDD